MRHFCLVLALALSGCAYRGTARDFSPAALSASGWLSVDGVSALRQESEAECGAAALAMVLNFWSLPTSVADVSSAHPELTESGSMRADDLRDYAVARGLSAFLLSGELYVLEHELSEGRPVIVGLIKRYGLGDYVGHYEVVVAYHAAEKRIVTLDPAAGLRENSLEGFYEEWGPSEKLTLVMFPK